MNEQPEGRTLLAGICFSLTMLVIAGVAISGACTVANPRARPRAIRTSADTVAQQYACGIDARRHAAHHAGAGACAYPSEAQKEGAQPALPPAPAEKVAPPIKDK